MDGKVERFERWPFAREKQLRQRERPTLDFTIRIGSTPTFLYFDLDLKSNLDRSEMDPGWIDLGVIAY